MSKQNPRFVALDVHKSYVMVGAVDSEQEIVVDLKNPVLAGVLAWLVPGPLLGGC